MLIFIVSCTNALIDTRRAKCKICILCSIAFFESLHTIKPLVTGVEKEFKIPVIQLIMV